MSALDLLGDEEAEVQRMEGVVEAPLVVLYLVEVEGVPKEVSMVFWPATLHSKRANRVILWQI